MENLNKYINQYLNYSYTVNEGYIITEYLLSINTIANDISLYYNITEKQAIQYILEYYNYKFNIKNSLGYWAECTYNQNGNQLTRKDSYGFWSECTYDHNGKVLTYKESNGYWAEWTYDHNGNQLTYKNSTGSWSEWTYDQNGNQLTYNNGKSK